MKNKSINVLGVPLFDGDIIDITTLVIDKCKLDQYDNHLISLTGAHGIVTSKKDEHFKDILKNNFFLNLSDGMPNVWIAKLKGAKKIERCSGPDFFGSVLEVSASKKIKHFFCGGQPGVAEDLKRSVSSKFNNNSIVGTFCPPFLKVEEYDYKAIASIINNTNTDILWVGISTPKQEKFAYNLSKFVKVKFIITVGAAFDFHTGRLKPAPKFLQKIGLEWLVRLVAEPRRLYKRYLEIVPKYIYLNILEFLTSVVRR